MKNYKRAGQLQTDRKTDKLIQNLDQMRCLCQYCGRYEGCNRGGRSGLPSFKKHRWRTWKYNRKTQWKSH